MIRFPPFLRAFGLALCPLLVGSLGTAAGSPPGGAAFQVSSQDVPDWFLDNRPMDPDHVFAAATATAPKLQLASSKAAAQARGDIAATIETKLEGLSKQFQEEIGSGPNAESVSQFTQTYKSVVSQTLNGAEVVKREIQREGDEFRAYVLMRMPIGQAQEELLARVQEGRNAFTRFRNSQAFEELEREVEDYQEREKEQARRKNPQPNNETEEREMETNETGESSGESNEDPTQTSDGGETQPNEGPLSEAQRIESNIRSAADSWMGSPYEFGGESRSGVDCSALTQALYEDAFSIGLPRTTGKQVNRGNPVEQSEMRAGDLVFFRTADRQKHVGIYLDDGEFLHASSSRGVTISPMQNDYWQQNYWTARRLPAI
jgi:cell wall-associated NlpC family hydrolase